MTWNQKWGLDIWKILLQFRIQECKWHSSISDKAEVMLYKADMWTNEIRNIKVHGWSTKLGGIDDIELKLNPSC